jgi:hypothetical protein
MDPLKAESDEADSRVAIGNWATRFFFAKKVCKKLPLGMTLKATPIIVSHMDFPGEFVELQR